MLARVLNKLHLSRGQKAIFFAYAAVMAVGSGIGLKIMAAMEGENAIPPEPTLVDNWIVIACGIAAGAALYLAQGWLGGRGVLGLARALVAMVLVTFVAALIAGTLVAPFYGTLAAPFVLLSEFISAPLLAAAWIGVLFCAHLLCVIRRDELDWDQTHSAVSQLSQLSQASLYGHRARQ